VDVVYPPENRPLYEMILETGGVISEYLPGASPLSRQFPSRNRIISGLADALVVVEAREKSGTMITVDMALEQGREVYALPGRLVDPLSVGCNHLIRQGATPIVDIAEFCEEFLAAAAQRLAGRGLEGARAMATVKKKRKAVPPAQPARAAPLPKKRGFSAEEEEVLAALDYTPCPLERIASACPRVPYDRLLKILVTFCLKGHARQMGAGNYCLMDE
jgi:DNA processing protein